MKKLITILVSIVLIVVSAGVVYNFFRPRLQVCPDKKIINMMPGRPGSSYYVKEDGVKKISDYDSVWVEKNCVVPVETVY